MTTNKPKIAAWIRNERGEHAQGPATFDPMCIFGSPEPQGLVASYSPVVMFTDYEALQAECERLRAEVAEWKRVAVAQAELHGEAEERAERLVEVLKDAEEHIDMTTPSWYNSGQRMLKKIRDLLRDHEEDSK